MRFLSPAAKHPADPWLLWIIIVITALGFIIFTSASVGLIAREGAKFGDVALTRLFATVLGGALAVGVSLMDYRLLRKYALAILLVSIGLTSLVFIPGIGIEHGGANRWISVFGITSFQPAELLKIAFVIYAAAFFASVREKVGSVQFGLFP